METLTFELNDTYFVISDLELDVEFGYISSVERSTSAQELEQFIECENIAPRCGASVIHPDDIIYIPSTGSIDYAETMFYYANAC